MLLGLTHDSLARLSSCLAVGVFVGHVQRLDVPMLGNPDSDIVEVTRYLDKQTATMRSIKEEVERLKHYQRMLKQVLTVDSLSLPLSLTSSSSRFLSSSFLTLTVAWMRLMPG